MKSILSLPTDQPFDYQMAMDRLRDFQSPRDKLGALCDQGAVVRVKKGLYVAGNSEGQQQIGAVDPLVLSGLIYGPSYVSLETALSRYGMIPERVTAVTCMASKRAREFSTPVGRFFYRPVSERAFPVGLSLESLPGGSCLMATAEKALCDRVAQVRGLSAQREVAVLLEEELRLDMESLSQLDPELIRQIAAAYRKVNVTLFAKWFLKHVASGRS